MSKLKDFFIHNPDHYNEKENLQWCWLRAVEWGGWPLFLAPPLFMIVSWWQVTIAVIILTWAWTLIRYNYVNIILVGLGPFVIIFKWPVSVGIGIYFLINNNYLLAVISAFWPVITLLLMLLTPPTKVGVIQTALMNKLGYEQLI